MNKIYLAFVGNENCTYGKPHPTTGHYNKYGKLISFDSKKERDKFCEKWDNKFNAYPIATNKKEAKSRFCAGMTQEAFEEYTNYCESQEDLNY